MTVVGYGRADCRIGCIAGFDSRMIGTAASHKVAAEHYYRGRSKVEEHPSLDNRTDSLDLAIGMDRWREERHIDATDLAGKCLVGCTAGRPGRTGRRCSNSAPT